MKRFAVIFLLYFLGISISFSQKIPYDKQEFAIRDLNWKQQSETFGGRIDFTFKIFAKYARNEVMPAQDENYTSYYLRFYIVATNGDTLVKPSDLQTRQTYSFFGMDTGKYKSYSYGHKISIPYSYFKKSGDLNFNVYGQAENATGNIKLKPFYIGPYKANIPKTIALEKQKITLSDIISSEDTQLKGITIKFNSIFTYAADELSSSESSDEVLFYVDFTDMEGNPIASANHPSLIHNKRNWDKYYKLDHKKNITRAGELFFPYSDFYLAKGTYKIKYSIHATSHGYSADWKNLANGEITMHMPTIYFAKAAVTGIKVIEKSYDVAGKDIPIIGMFFSSTSKSGNGYPDLFWTLGTEKRNHIYSSMSTNSYTAYDDSASFQMLEDDLLSLNVYDHDVLSFNDYLGGITIPKMSGPNTYKANIKNNDVIAGKVFIKRDYRPDAKTVTLFSKTTVYNGVSGYQIYGNTPKENNVSNRFFLRKADGTNEIPNWVQMNPIPADYTFSYFVPAWDLQTGSSFGVLSSDTYYQLPLCQKYAAPEKYITESNDVHIKLNPFEKIIKNGVNGINLSIEVIYPSGLGSMKNQCKFNYTFKNNVGADLKPILDKLKPEGLPVCPENNCKMVVFIPFYMLYNYSGKLFEANLSAQALVRNNFMVGKADTKLQSQIPIVFAAPKVEFSADLKFLKNWSYVNIAVEYGGDEKIFLKEYVGGGKVSIPLQFPTEYLTEGDDISIVLTPYEFRTPLDEIRWTIKTEQLKNGELILTKNKRAKKAMLKTN